jgi:hypothetical protein
VEGQEKTHLEVRVNVEESLSSDEEFDQKIYTWNLGEAVVPREGEGDFLGQLV